MILVNEIKNYFLVLHRFIENCLLDCNKEGNFIWKHGILGSFHELVSKLSKFMNDDCTLNIANMKFVDI